MDVNQEILELLQNNARISNADIAAMTKKSVAEIERIIAQFEEDGVILKYTAVVNDEKLHTKHAPVRAEIEIQITPEREHGFDSIAEQIYQFPEVRSLYLMSGGYDLKVIVEGETLKDVAFFVAHRLAPLNGIKSTKTHFMLKIYKENDVLYVAPERDRREGITA